MWRFFFFSLLTFSVDSAEVAKERMKRFSIFSLVQFPNSDCTSTTSTPSNPIEGTCFTQSECNSNGGSVAGNCASGFGVCCILSVSTCGSTITKNGTYVQNPGNPSGYSTAGNCAYSFTATTDICQLRFDFNILTLTQPATAGATQGFCNTDSVSFVSASASSAIFPPAPPPLCGVLTGSHIYLETGRVVNAATMTFTIGAGGGATRAWRVKVSRIECGNPNAAPTDCLQYYTGISGTFQSFNFNGGAGQTIVNQNYNMCFRQERGYCKIVFSQDAASAATTPKNFNVGNNAGFNGLAQRLCSESGLLIPSTYANFGFTNSIVGGVPSATQPNPSASQRESYCGSLLNQIAHSTMSGVVTATVAPFNVGVFSTSPLSLASTGFNLMYREVPC